MKITGDQLNFLIQSLKDSLTIPIGYDYSFQYKREKRELFYEDFIQSILSVETVDVGPVDLSNLR